MKQFQKGFTLIELMVVCVIALIIFSVFSNGILNNRGSTESRAKENAQLFIKENNLEVTRLNCAGDSDNDGYGSCTVVVKDGEKIMLECPAGFFQTNLFGATGCKEVFMLQKLNIR